MGVISNSYQPIQNLIKIAEKESLGYQNQYLGTSLLKKLLRYKWKYIVPFFLYIMKMMDILNDEEINLFELLNAPWEIKLVKFFLNNLTQHDIFYDIGAGHGLYTKLAVNTIKVKEVHSFEPLPHAFSHTYRNFKDKKNVFINNVAVADKSGKTVFFENKQLLSSELSTMIESVVKFDHRENEFKKIEVLAVTIDDYIKDHHKPTVIKIDVEGGEGLVIEGGRTFFLNNNPLISLEIWPGEMGKSFSLVAAKKLYEMGYNSYRLNNDGSLIFYSAKELFNWIDASDETENFIFKKD